jgi:hypothetical protein
MINLLSSPASSLHSVAGRRASVVARTHNQRQESALSRVEGQLEWRTATVTQNRSGRWVALKAVAIPKI